MKKPQQIISEFEQKLNALTDKKAKVVEILDFALLYGDSFGEDIIKILEDGTEISKEIGFKQGEVICYIHLLFFGSMTKGHAETKYSRNVNEIIEMLESIQDDHEWFPIGLNQLAFFHWFRGEYEKAFNTIFRSTKLAAGRNKLSMAWNEFALGVFYFDTKDFENSRIHYQEGLDLFIEAEQEYGKARATTGLGSVAIMQNKPNEARPLLENAAAAYRKLSHHSGLSRAVNDLGLIEKANKNYTKAIELLTESVELRKEIKHLQGLITSYTELGEIYLLSKDYASALQQLKKGMELALAVRTAQKQMRLHKLLYDTYKELKNTDLALENLEKYYEIKSQLLSDEASNNIKKIQTRFEKEKSEKEAEIERLKNVELKIAYKEIEEKNKEIIDSITYALRIQKSLMPTDKHIEKTLNRLKDGPNI